MREILFKAKRIDNEKWISGLLCYNIYGQLCIQPVESDNCCVIIPETVGQYTGLTDKNGERIFEGDIVTAYNAMGECTHTATAVKWNDFFAEWSIGKCNSMYSDGSICYYEVIGNIHDNPELIGGDSDA